MIDAAEHEGRRRRRPAAGARRARHGVLTVMADDGAGGGADRRQHELDVGEELVVGSCRCPDCRAGMVVQAAPGLWFRATVRARQDHWTLDNLSPDVDLWCVDLEDAVQRLRVAPGRAGVAVPFEFTRVEPRHRGRRAGGSLTVIGQDPGAHAVPPARTCDQNRRQLRGAGLQAGTTYMAVMEALCRGSAATGVPPTSAQIAETLAVQGMAITRRAVDHHIDYVFDRLVPDAGSERLAPGAKRLALVSMLSRARLAGTQPVSSPYDDDRAS